MVVTFKGFGQTFERKYVKQELIETELIEQGRSSRVNVQDGRFQETGEILKAEWTPASPSTPALFYLSCEPMNRVDKKCSVK